METITSADEPGFAANSIVNQVQFTYNPFGQLTTEYQEHGGGVNTSTSPKVGYSYADGFQGHIRPTSLLYPNGRILSYGYNAGTDDVANRVSFLADTSPLPPGEGQGEGLNQQLVNYQYLGLGTILDLTYPQPGIRGTFDVDTAAPGTYPGLDQFGRVVDLLWKNVATGAALERIQHGYDLVSNRLWRQCPVATTAGKSFDELYSYDGVNQLRSFQRGSLAAGQTSLASGTENFAQQWTLDATGNWVEFQEDDTGGGTWSLDQTRTHDPANEIAGFAESAGPAWAQPAYDRAGNMTSLPQPASPASSFTCTYDGWNRLVKVVDASTNYTVAEYQYDGRNFRAVKKTFADGGLAETRHYYFSNDQWQLLEERVGASSAADRQHVWGLRFSDDIVLRDRVCGRLYYAQGPNWSVTAILGTDASVVERYRFDPYGAAAIYDGEWGAIRPASDFDNETLYSGRSLDRETGLLYYRARYYDARLGRFVGRDPVGYGFRNANLYRYVGGNPLTGVDPWGLDPVIAAGAGALAIEAAEGGAIAAAGPAVAAGAAAVAGPYLAYKYVSPYTSAAAGRLTEEWYRYWYGVPGATISLANDATMQKHLQDLRNALDDLADLKEKLRNSKGKKCQDALKDAIKDLSKDIDGHVKEINQRWPNALKP